LVSCEVIRKREHRGEYYRRWLAVNPEKKRDSDRRWRVENADKVRENNRRWQAENPEKARENNRRWRVENPEKAREKSRRWAAANPDVGRRWCAHNPELVKTKRHRHRVRKLSVMGDFTAEQFAALCAHFKQHCLKCGRPRKLTPDHVIPLAWADRPEFVGVALGDIDNIQPLCRSCNSSKQDTYVDYRTQPHRNCINPPMVEDYLA